jgi:hypothetical protein
VDEIGSGWCPMAGFGICYIELSSSTTTQLVTENNLMLFYSQASNTSSVVNITVYDEHAV